MNSTNLLASPFLGARVVDSEVSNRHFFGHGKLRTYASEGGCFGAPVAFHQSTELCGFIDGDDNEGVEPTMHPVLHNQGCLVQDVGRILLLQRSDGFGTRERNCWMRDCIETLACVWICKHELPDLLAIEGTVRCEDTASERSHNFLECFRSGLDNLACEVIGVDHGHVKLTKHARDGALPARDATRQTDNLRSHDRLDIPPGPLRQRPSRCYQRRLAPPPPKRPPPPR